MDSVRSVHRCISTGSWLSASVTSRFSILLEKYASLTLSKLNAVNVFIVHCCAAKASRTSFSHRYWTALGLLLYAMLTGCVRTATLGVTTVLNPITGHHGFASELTANINDSRQHTIRIASAAALVLLGYAIKESCQCCRDCIMMIDVCHAQRITGRYAMLHKHVHVASGASAVAVACADSWLSISTLLIHGRTRVSTAQVAPHDCRCVCNCVTALLHAIQ